MKCLDFNEHHRKELDDKGYIFFENFFDINSYKLINESFPNKCFLRKHRNINKIITGDTYIIQLKRIIKCFFLINLNILKNVMNIFYLKNLNTKLPI